MERGTSYTRRFFAILEILKRESNRDHRLQQTAIVRMLEDLYNMSIDRRSVKKTLEELQYAGYPVVYDHGWYYRHEFTEAEIFFLLDSIRGNDCLPPEQQERLLKKVSALGGRWAASPENHNQLKTTNPCFLDTLLTLHKAIEENTQVEFFYGNYDVDMKLYPRTTKAGNPKLYIINPYQITVVNGHYYLVANVHRYSGLSHYRIDRIMEIKNRKRKRKPLRVVYGCDTILDIAQYTVQHPYMYSGEVREHRIVVERKNISDVFDWFGKEVTIEAYDEKRAVITIQAETMSMDFWLRRYAAVARPIRTPEEWRLFEMANGTIKRVER